MSTAETPPGPAVPRSSWPVRVVFVALSAVLVMALVAAGTLVSFALLRLSDAPPATAVRIAAAAPADDSEPAPDIWDRHGPINVLLIGTDTGLDSGCRGSGYGLTDTLILVRFDPATGKAGMMSIPRDLYVPMPGRIARKITTAYSLGENDGDGMGYLRQTIANNLELPVHRFVRIDLAGFERIVDELGGVDIDVPPSSYNPQVGLYDAEYPDANCGTIVVEFKPGEQHLDGTHALQYARSRHTTSDFDRSRRQMDVLMAMRGKALSLGILRRPGVIPAVLDTVATDFTTREILALVGPGMEVSDANIMRYPIDSNVVYSDWIDIDGAAQSVLRLRPEEYRLLREKFVNLEDPRPTPTPTPNDALDTAASAPHDAPDAATPAPGAAPDAATPTP